MGWLFMLLLCLYATWEQDYFAFKETMLSNGLKDFRDPVYYYLAELSGESYIIFRFYIWGGALLLYWATCRRLHLPTNMAIYILSTLFSLSFTYARATSAMALYFYGLSFLFKPWNNKMGSYVWGAILVFCSFFFHRSMALLICFVPFAFFKMNKSRLLVLLVLMPVLILFVNQALNVFFAENIVTSDTFSAFAESAQTYAALDDDSNEYNWKFALSLNMRTFSFYLVFAYLLYRLVLSRTSKFVKGSMKQYMTICSCIIILATTFFWFIDIGATSLLGRRYLYMLGIPCSLLLSYCVEQNICSWKGLHFLLLPSMLYSEGFLIGKIFSLWNQPI